MPVLHAHGPQESALQWLRAAAAAAATAAAWGGDAPGPAVVADHHSFAAAVAAGHLLTPPEACTPNSVDADGEGSPRARQKDPPSVSQGSKF
eukprot:1157839-Pelagomonas_calceolata.AAC.2